MAHITIAAVTKLNATRCEHDGIRAIVTRPLVTVAFFERGRHRGRSHRPLLAWVSPRRTDDDAC
jgi:hypothetical protein